MLHFSILPAILPPDIGLAAIKTVPKLERSES